MNRKIVPQLHTLLREAVLEFHSQLPPGVADLRIGPNNPPSVFTADIIPRSGKAAPISVSAEEGDWEAMVAFGSECQIDARYYKRPDADQAFKEEVLTICRAVAGSHWQERIVMRGDRVFKAIALLPLPLGEKRISGLGPFLLSRLRRKTEKVINWEPYS